MQQKPQQQKNPFQKDENLVTQLISRYISFWPLFILAGALAFGAAYVYLRYTTPLYEATATLIIKDEKKGYEDSKVMESLNMISTKKIIENEVEVLQSRSLMEKVVKSLKLYAPISQEGKVRSVPAYTTTPIMIELYNPDDLVEKPKVHIRYDASSRQVFLDGRQVGTVNEWINTAYGRMRFIPNPKYKPSELNKPYYFSLVDVRTVTKNILRQLKVVAASKLSSIINLSYRDEVPARAEDVLNELIRYYDRAAIDEKNSLAKNTLEFVEERLNAVGTDIDSMNKIVTRYKSTQGASDISTQGQLFLQSVSSNDQRLGEINMQLAAIGQVEKNMSSGSTASLPSTLGSADPALSTLMNDLNSAEIEYEKLRKTVAENNPMLVSIRDKINKLRPTIMENIQSQKASLEASRSTLSSQNQQYTSRLSRIPVKERELVDMSRDLNIKNGIYQFLLQKKEESELSYASTLSDSRVVNKAQSTKKPVSPNKMLIYLAAMVAAMGVCIIFISAREAFSRKVLYRQEVESLTSVPIIGEVAFNKSSGEALVIEAGKRSFIAEEFRKIRVSLHFLGINTTTNKRILVTSSIPGEGKSFVAANLAISHSLTGKKVILIDADLHNPGLGRTFGKTPDDPGLSDCLAGRKKLEDIIVKVPEHDNLHFISSGHLHEAPSELLLNERINEVLSKLDSMYDLVVIDTAPVVLVTDAYILSALCNVTIYVVRHKYTPKMLIKRIDENNRINPLINPAIVFNGVKVRGFFKNNYGYGYDYVYGEKEKKKYDKKKNDKNKPTNKKAKA